MGAGKTTIGGKLAENLGMQFIDLDQEIERKTGAQIPLIFELEGEAGFRKRESRIFKALSQKKHLVLATGGGVILSKENRDTLKKSGVVIYLMAPLEQLLKRTAKDRNRPLLQTENPRQTLANILKEREHYYKEVADICIETDQKLLRDIVHEISQLLINFEKTS
ncbi:MAG TPA: shikimate kinase [Gammaproteobacteria bacterium]|nr:shikimate kinase [Gammaproteobacteria bacterium]